MEENKPRKRKANERICLALFILLKKKAYEDITVKEISDRAGVTRMSFYRHFQNKEDVFVYYINERAEEFERMIFKMQDKSLNSVLVAFFNFIHIYKDSIEALIKVGKFSIMLEQFDNCFAYLFHKFMSPTNSKLKMDKYIISFISGGIYNVTLNWFKDGLKYTPNQLADEITRFLTSLGND